MEPLPYEKAEAKAIGAMVLSTGCTWGRVSTIQVGLAIEGKLLMSFCTYLEFSLCSVELGVGEKCCHPFPLGETVFGSWWERVS